MVTTFYEVRDRAGVVMAVHKRVDDSAGKRVAWLQSDGSTGLNGTPVADLPLYGLHRMSEWPEPVPIVVCEGEKVAEALWSIGIAALGTVTGAAGTPSGGSLSALTGRAVVLSPDNDDVGRSHMRRIADSLEDLAAVGWLEPPAGKPQGWDLADAVAEGVDARALIAGATDYFGEHGGSKSDSGGATLTSLSSLSSHQSPYPRTLAAEAYHGLAGDFARAVEPHTEADPVAILASFLVMAGSLVGDRVRAMAGDRPHPARLYALITGDTSKGRKGTSGAPVESIAKLADPSFEVVRGLSSGEGLIFAVRDPVEKIVQVGKGVSRHPELQVVDEGVTDKRLLVIESEFASVLRVLQRDGNTLSGMVRTAWEAGDLRTMTRTSPLSATGAHISILGHVSREELVRYLDRTDLANGFANRFLMIAARRQKLLPKGGNVPPYMLNDYADRLLEVMAWADESRFLERDALAEEMWAAVYGPLSEGGPGLLGAATARAEAQALRLQVAYALLDRSDTIRPEHVLASLAVWDYAKGSARWVFGDALGDTIADAILEAVAARGELTRTDISNLFSRHVERSRIERALVSLVSTHRVSLFRDTSTGGRPREVYRHA